MQEVTAGDGDYNYRGTRIGITTDLSSDTTQARSKWHEILKVLKEKKKHTNLEFYVQ